MFLLEGEMKFITIELNILDDPKIKILMQNYKSAFIVWIYLLIKFGKEENNGFMIFIDDKWYREFAKEINLSSSSSFRLKCALSECFA